MHAVPFDTLNYAKKLEAGGFPAQQAETQAKALAEVLEQGVNVPEAITKTETQIMNLKLELASIKSELLNEIGNVKVEVANVKTEVANIKSELLNEIGNVKIEVANVKSDMIKWFFGISAGQAALVLSILKFFH